MALLAASSRLSLPRSHGMRMMKTEKPGYALPGCCSPDETSPGSLNWISEGRRWHYVLLFQA